MEVALGTQENISDAVEGATILRLEFTDEGVHIVLKDGRTLVLPDAQIIAVCQSKYFLQ